MTKNNNMRLVFFTIVVLLVYSGTQIAHGHVSDDMIQTKILKNYTIQFTTRPSSPIPNAITTLVFSVQDTNGLDANNVTASISTRHNGSTVKNYPIQIHSHGDFTYDHLFVEDGNYEIILKIHEPTEILTAVFDVTVNSNALTWPIIYLPLIVLGVFLVLGSVVYLKNKFGTEFDNNGGNFKLKCNKCGHLAIHATVGKRDVESGISNPPLLCTRCGSSRR